MIFALILRYASSHCEQQGNKKDYIVEDSMYKLLNSLT